MSTVKQIVAELLQGAEERLSFWVDPKKLDNSLTANSFAKGSYLLLVPQDLREEVLELQEGLTIVGPVEHDKKAKRLWGPRSSFRFVTNPFAQADVVVAAAEPVQDKAGA